MQAARIWVFGLLACSAVTVAGDALAQPAGLDPGRHCQNIRTCNYARGGVYRGCVSTYSCRVCRFVPAACRIDAGRRVCDQVRCTWG